MLRDLVFAERLASLIPPRGKAGFARAIGVRPQQLSKYLRGQVPFKNALERIAAVGGCSVAWLLTGCEEAAQYEPSARASPMVKEESARYAPDQTATMEERELIGMLLAILRGRNRENVEAIKSNIRAFYKSREMDSEPTVPTQRKVAG